MWIFVWDMKILFGDMKILFLSKVWSFCMEISFGDIKISLKIQRLHLGDK
jgi:hypothetical protein